jgi:GT2 family glycosyltransferase
MDDKVTVVVVHYMVEAYLDECIHSVIEESGELIHKIIIINNGSKKNIRFSNPKISITENTRNSGFAAACNLGLRQIESGYCLILNPDTKIQENAISDCIRYMKKNPHIGILGCLLHNSDGSLQSSCRNFPSITNVFVESLGFHRFLGRFAKVRSKYLMVWPHDQIRIVDSVKGAFFLVKKEVIQKIGYLDENFFMYCEEVDYCARARKAGWDVVFYPGAQIIHYGGKSTEINSLNNLIELHRSQRYYCEKHMNAAEAGICILLYFSGLIFRMILNCPMPWHGSIDKEKRTKRFILFYETAKSYFKS